MSPTSSNPSDSLTDVSDVELAARAAGSDRVAFEELYRRHVAAAWRVAQAVTGDRTEAADAVATAFVRVLHALHKGRMAAHDRFRPFLLATTRRAAVEQLRKAGRLRPADDTELAAVADTELDESDQSPVSAAFRSLPERWRTALWLAEVEGMEPGETAPLLGVSRNGAAQLARRARAALRERYVQVQMANDANKACRFTTDRLSAYLARVLPARDVAKVEQHLDSCELCSIRRIELDDLAGALRRSMIPIPLGLAAIAISRWDAAFAAASAGHHVDDSPVSHLRKRQVAVASTAALALGIVGATLAAQPSHPRPGEARVALAAPAVATPSSIVVTPIATPANDAAAAVFTPFGPASPVQAATTIAAAGGATDATPSAQGTTTDTGSGSTATPPPAAQFGPPAPGSPVSTPPGVVPPGTVPPGTVPPGTIPPVTLPPGTLPPGTIPPVTIPPATIPGTTIPPTTTPPGTTPPGTIPAPVLPPVTLPVTVPPTTLPPVTIPIFP